jgi:D-alanyl-D-alanine carboxypeptidase
MTSINTGSPYGKLLAVTNLLFVALILATSSASSASAAEAKADSIEPISPMLCQDMKVHKVLTDGAPVGCPRLSLVKFSYFGFDEQIHRDGEIMVMDAAAEHALQIFSKLKEMHFPIAKATLLNHYDGNDDASMADDNTSAFNARKIVGGTSLSLHAYGLAIDINPIQNPYAKRSGRAMTFDPPSGAEYANRFNDRPWKIARPGMAESVIDVFADQGFLIWGGYWSDPVDYQHFQVTRSLAEELARVAPLEAHTEFEGFVERYGACRNRSSSRAACVMNSTRTGKPDY